jgi:TetR/AcrR family transcriptional regulator, mexCD-oprJ operon repressor
MVRAAQQGLQRRVSSAILEAAATVFATRGAHASMNDVAMEAGVARATLYRYFPSRQALLQELVDIALIDAGARLSAARIAELPVEEAVRRAVRALMDLGDAFILIAREHARGDGKRFDEHVALPLRALCTRGQEASVLRDDASSEWLTEFLIVTVTSALVTAHGVGRDDLVELVASVFFDGARRRRPTLEAI